MVDKVTVDYIKLLEKKIVEQEQILALAHERLHKLNNSGDLYADLQEVLVNITQLISPNTVIITSTGGVMEVNHQPEGIKILMVDYEDKP
jgi:hypothetical protein